MARITNKHFLVLVGNSFSILVGFALSFLMFHYMPVREVGMWFLVMSVSALCEAARSGFLATATVSFYAGAARDRGKEVLGSVWALAGIMSAVIMIIDVAGWLCLPLLHNQEAGMCIRWAGLTYLSTVAIDVVNWKLQAEEKYDRIFLYRLVNSISTMAAFCALIATDRMTLQNALLYNIITNCLVSAWGIWQSGRIDYIVKASRKCMMEIVHYGKYMLGTTSLTTLLVNADTWIINWMLGPASVAVYNLATRFMTVIELPIRTFVTTGMSEMAVAYNSEDKPRVLHLFKKYAGMLTVGFIPIICIAVLFADIPIHVLGGARYANTIAADSFRLFLLVSLFYPLDRFNGLVLDIVHQTRANFYKVLLMLAIKVGANFAGLALFGNIYGINLSYYLVTIAALVLGNYQLSRIFTYRIAEVLSTGYIELRAMVTSRIASYRLGRAGNS